MSLSRVLNWMGVLVCGIGLSVAASAAEKVVEPNKTGTAEAIVEQAPDRAAALPAQAFDADSGVSVNTLCTNCNNADLSIGGLGNDHVNVTCDGLPVAPGLGQIYLLSVMPATLIDRVSVTKGAGEPELDAGAVGGGIEISRTRAKPGVNFNASADLGQYGWAGGKADLSGRRGRFGGYLAASLGSSDSIDANGDGFPNMPSFNRYTLEGNVEIELNDRQKLRVGVVGYDESQKDGPAAAATLYDPMLNASVFRGYNRENVELNRQQYELSYDGRVGRKDRFKVGARRADRSQEILETENLTDFFNPTYFIDETRDHLGASWTHSVGVRAAIRGGASLSRGTFDVVDVFYNQSVLFLPPDQATSFPFTEVVTESGIWLEADVTLSSKFDLSAGLRYADIGYEDDENRAEWMVYSLPEDSKLLPRAALNFKPGDAWQFRFSAGTGLRAPYPAHEEVCCGRRYRGNRGTVTEESSSFGVEMTYQPDPGFRLGASVFRTDFDNLLIKMASFAILFRPTYQNVNVPSARQTSYALDTNIELTDWLNVKASVSFLDAENRTADGAIPVLIDFGFPAEETIFSDEIPYLPDSRAAVALDMRPGKSGYNIGLSAQYTGKMRIQHFSDRVETLGILLPGFIDSDDLWVTNFTIGKALARGVTAFAGVDNLFDNIQTDLGDPTTEFNWGPLRGRYVYGGVSYRYD